MATEPTDDLPSLAILFGEGERWGWEYRNLRDQNVYESLYRPFPTPPPSLDQAQRSVQAMQSRLAQTEMVPRFAVAGCGLVIGISLLAASIGLLIELPGLAARNIGPIMLSILLVVGLGFFALWIKGSIRSRAQLNELVGKAQRETIPSATRWSRRLYRYLVPILTLGLGSIARWVFEPIILRIQLNRLINNAPREYSEAAVEWSRRRNHYHREENQRVLSLPQWGAARPLSKARRVDVFGGTYEAWQDLLTTFGASVLGSGQSLFVLDLSEADVPAQLCREARAIGLSTEVVLLPRDQELLDVFAGLDSSRITDIIVEGLHTHDDPRERQKRARDNRILQEICSVLAPDITLERLSESLQIVQRRKYPPEDSQGPVTASEWSRLSQLFPDEYRQGIRDQLIDLEAQLDPLRGLGRRRSTAILSGEPPRLECISISRESTALHNELLVDLLMQVAIRRLRDASRSATGERTVAVVGADALKRRHMERLDSLAATLGIRVVYMFAHLRDDSLEVAGSGSVVAFMRIADVKEAERAADHVAKAYKFVLSQLSRSKGTTNTLTWGHGGSEGWTRGTSIGPGLFGGVTEQTGEQQGTSWNKGGSTSVSDTSGETTQRVHEHVVEPEIFRSLPDTGLLLVEFSNEAPGGRRVLTADCDPRIAALTAVSRHPFPEAPDYAAEERDL